MRRRMRGRRGGRMRGRMRGVRKMMRRRMPTKKRQLIRKRDVSHREKVYGDGGEKARSQVLNCLISGMLL